LEKKQVYSKNKTAKRKATANKNPRHLKKTRMLKLQLEITPATSSLFKTTSLTIAPVLASCLNFSLMIKAFQAFCCLQDKPN